MRPHPNAKRPEHSATVPTDSLRREMTRSLEALWALYRAALRAADRHLRAGRARAAARLDADARYLRSLIAAMTIELPREARVPG